MQTFEDLLSQHPSWSENEMKAASIAWIWRDAEIEALRGRMEALLNKLDQVKKDTKGIFVMAQIHGIAYSGANWSDEYKACRELLAALDAPAGKGDSNGQA